MDILTTEDVLLTGDFLSTFQQHGLGSFTIIQQRYHRQMITQHDQATAQYIYPLLLT